MTFSGDVGLIEVTSLQSKLANHRRQQAGSKLLATVLDDRPVIVAVQKQDMATFAFHRVDPNLHAAGTANLTNPVDELPARHI